MDGTDSEERKLAVLPTRVSPLVVIIAIVLLLALIAGIYVVLVRRQAEILTPPVVKNDPYAGQYQGPAAPPYPDGVPPAP